MNVTQKLARSLFDLLHKKNQRLVLAESCTCGKVAGALGEISGLSEFFYGSFVTYRVDSKVSWLGVPKNLIEMHTAESKEVAKEMAVQAIQKTSKANLSLAVSGHENDKAYITVCVRTEGMVVDYYNTTHDCVGVSREHRLEGIVRQCLLSLILVLED